jgi:hypothetical protein
MKKNQQGFGIPGILAVITVLGLVGVAGWLVLDRYKSNSNLSQPANSTDNNDAQLSQEKTLVLSDAKLPSGWSINSESSDVGRILLNNETTRCFTDVMYTTDTAESNSPEVDQNKQTVEGIKSKGYSVEETAGKIKIDTGSGEKEIASQVLRVTGLDNPMFQEYAYLATAESYTRIQLSCSNETDLPSAEAALLAVKFTKL